MTVEIDFEDCELVSNIALLLSNIQSQPWDVRRDLAVVQVHEILSHKIPDLRGSIQRCTEIERHK